MTLSIPVRAALVAALLHATAATAQVEFDLSFIEAPQSTANFAFGASLLAVDVDGDGFCDLVVGEPNANTKGVLWSGRAWIWYGPDFQRRKEISLRKPVEREFLATKRSVFGDFDGDGVPDLVLLAPTAQDPTFLQGGTVGRARLFRGPEFEEQILIEDPTPQLFDARFGWTAEVLNHPATGKQELLISTPHAWSIVGGIFWYIGEIITWPDGVGARSTVIENPEPAQTAYFGTTVVVADVNGDGLEEIVASNYGHHPGGKLSVLDGKTRQLLWTVNAPPSTPQYGPIISFDLPHFAGDLRGDGSVSLVVGAPSTWIGPIKPGMLFVLGGPDFSVVEHAILPPNPVHNGSYGEEAFVADVDADGFPDIVVNSIGNSLDVFDNVVDIHFGPDFTRVQTLSLAAKSYGVEATAGDFDGDGTLEIAVTAMLGSATGRVYIYNRRSLSADVDAISVSAGTPVGLALDFGVPGAHRDYLVALSLSGSAPGLIVAPGSFLPLNPDAATLAGFALIHTTVLDGFSGILDADGRASATLNWPAGAGTALVGQQLTLAAMALAPGNRPGYGSSAVTLPIGP